MDPRIWGGTTPLDDAVGMRLDDGRILFQSIDVITPPCNDPYMFGRIAAANALSDLYARAVRPLCAMHILAIPPKQVPPEMAARILQGAIDALTEAGAVSMGGHTLKEGSVFYGIAVTGTAREDQVISMKGARPGDCLVLTKPIGTGVLIEHARNGTVPEDVLNPVLEAMARLNARAARAMCDFEAHAATDVTGFGLIGHAWNLAHASDVDIEIEFARVPVYPAAQSLFQEGRYAGAYRANQKYYGQYTEWANADMQSRGAPILFDPQTSGGLLIAVPETRARALCDALRDAGESAWIIGRVIARQGTRVRVHIR